MNPTNTKVLHSELHLHLYGCLTPQDLFDLGRDHFQERTEALDWYAAEYQKYAKKKPDWRLYWADSNGPERIAADFLAVEPMTFPEFQARFNLMIALLPTLAYAPAVMRQIIPEQMRQGITYGEHRIFVPPGLSTSDLAAYYQSLADAAHKLNALHSGAHAMRIILSMSRTPETFLEQYRVLKDVQQISPTVAENITGIDFCGVEEGFPPEMLADTCRLVRRENSADPERALAILYHVGESFDGMSVFSALRWIVASDRMGAHRLGHAIAAGIRIHNQGRFADGIKFVEPPDQLAAVIAFLQNDQLLPGVRSNPACQFLASVYQKAAASDGNEIPTFIWNEDFRLAGTTLQTMVLEYLRSRSAIIESCPTSNRIIGRIPATTDLPVFRFAEKSINMVISSDDPGIFATSLAKEELICRAPGGLSATQLASAAENNVRLRAGLLAGRPVW